MRFSNLSVGQKLWLCMGTAIFFVVMFCAVAQYALSSASARFSEIIDNEFAIVGHGNSAKIAFLEARRNEKDVLYNDDESLVKKILSFSSQMIDEGKAADLIAARTGDATLAQMTAALIKSGEEYQRLFKVAAASPVGQPRMVATIPVRKAAAEAENQLNLLLKEAGKRISGGREEAEQRSRTIEIVVLLSGLFVVGLGVTAALLLRLQIAKPLTVLHDRVVALAQGDRESEIPFAERGDEVGKMAAAVANFRTSLIEAEDMRNRQQSEQKSQLERANRIQVRISNFEKVVAQALDKAASYAAELESTSMSMADTAKETSQQSGAVVDATERATESVQTVSSASEELSSSIAEINNQVTKSATAANEGVSQANETNAHVIRLKESLQKIDSFTHLISEIASQTNLLALNATIEAARAGDAGKGFAVVAAEVKALATQTTKATDEIATQVRAIHEQTDQTVESIESVTGRLGHLNELVSSIASAVEQQRAATNEIAASASHAARGTADVLSNIERVRESSERTGEASGQVLRVAQELGGNGEALRNRIEEFLKEVSAA